MLYLARKGDKIMSPRTQVFLNLTSLANPFSFRTVNVAQRRSRLRLWGSVRPRQRAQLLSSLLHLTRQRVPWPAPDLPGSDARRHPPFRCRLHRCLSRILLFHVQPLLLLRRLQVWQVCNHAREEQIKILVTSFTVFLFTIQSDREKWRPSGLFCNLIVIFIQNYKNWILQIRTVVCLKRRSRRFKKYYVMSPHPSSSRF